jgi:hypothetical protein
MVSSKHQRRSFVLTVRSEPNVDPIKALKRSLKTMLRRDGLKCLGIHEATGEGHEGPTQPRATPILPQSTDGPPLAQGQCVTGEPSIRSRS